MNRKIRSISISDIIDNQLIEDSRYRGLTISANISRILYDYFEDKPSENGYRLPVKNR
tara:strand:- start:57 stop:230 length:174 start_codon:yes stop_codon:yes gene_type:complete